MRDLTGGGIHEVHPLPATDCIPANVHVFLSGHMSLQ